MRKILILGGFIITACAHFDDSIETVDEKQQIYRVSTKTKEEGLYKVVKDNDICPNLYTIEKTEQKIQEEDGPIFYTLYTIKCIAK
jgi:hypothetical protein